MQEDAPAEVECVPAPQLMHAEDAEGEYVPRLHVMHVADDDAPNVLEYLPEPQLMQEVDDDAEAEYFPASHVEQVVDE